MNFDKPQQTPEMSQEKKEKLENFEKELQEAVETVAGLTEAEFVEQNAEIFGVGEEGEEAARQNYQAMEFPLRGFDSWDEELAEEMLKKLQEKVLTDYKLVDTFTQEDGSQVDVLNTKNEDMQAWRIKEKTGHTEWVLKPMEAQIIK
jgi:hypothetical protein